MVKDIVDVKNPILRCKSRPVMKIDKKIKSLARDLTDTLKVQKDPEGVGLAAVQLGKPLRMFAMVDNKNIRVIINPKILKIYKNIKVKAKEKSKRIKGNKIVLEGCLSVPYYYGPLNRPKRLILKYQNTDGLEKTEIFDGFSAQIVQHEMDHLNGILFVDQLIAEEKPLYQLDPVTKEWEEVKII